MGREMFNTTMALIGKNLIFQSKGKKPQRNVKWQLGTFLMRYGQLGSPVMDAALKMGIAEGTVVLYCTRVTRVIRELRENFGSWMSDVEQDESAAHIYKNIGFPDCVGSGDGSLIPSDGRPPHVGTNFLSRKGFFGVCRVFLSIVVSLTIYSAVHTC